MTTSIPEKPYTPPYTTPLIPMYVPESELFTSLNLTAHTPSHAPVPYPIKKRRRKTVTPEYFGTEFPSLTTQIHSTANGQWIIDELSTGQFGFGPDPGAAINDLMSTLEAYFQALKARRYLLSPRLRAHLELLQVYFGSGQ